MGRTAAHWAASRAQPCLVLLQRAGFVGGPAMHQSRSHGRFCEILNAYMLFVSDLDDLDIMIESDLYMMCF